MPGSSSGRTRVVRTREESESLVAQFEGSGLSCGAFCREHAVAPSSFNKARRRLQGSTRQRVAQPAPFVAVSVPPPAVEASKPVWDVELQLSAETVIRLRMR